MIGKGGCPPSSVEDGSTMKIVKVRVLVSVSLHFAQSSLKPLIITLKKQASEMHGASPGAMVAVIAQTQFMHLRICKNLSVILTGDRCLDSIMRWRLMNIYFFPLVSILSALIGCLGMHLETQQQSTDTLSPSLWHSGARVDAIKNICFLNSSGSGEKLEDDW